MREFWANAYTNAYAGFDFMFLLYALLAAVALLVIMRVTGLMRREARWHRALVCLYYIYIPAVFIVCGAAWSTVGSLEGTFLGAINDARPVVSRTSAEYASSAWQTIASTFRKDLSISLRDLCLTVARDYADKLMDGFIPGRAVAFIQPIVQPVVSGMKEGVALSIAKSVEDIALKKASDATSLDKDLLHTFWSADLKAALQGGLVCDILTHHAKKALAPLYFKVKLMFALLMLPVVLETGYALYRRRRKAE